ncbi:MAG: radical SAM protein, partial [Desulfurococcales archaeon]|nr:radical SAM protein [Desulfurococcales archaeon]
LSLDSLNPEVHDKFRGMSGAFKMTMRGIENLKDAGIPVGIRMTVTRWNIEEAPGMVDFAYSHGVSRVTYYVLDTIGRGTRIAGDLPTPRQLANFVDRLVEYAMHYEGRIEILLVRLNQAGIYIALKHSQNRDQMKQMLSIVEGSGGCGRKSISIYPDGSVKPCQFIDYITLGKLPEDKLIHIISPENKKLKPFIEPWNHLTGRKCGKCPYKAYCGGGSRNRALVLKGDFWNDDPLCMLDDDYNPIRH